MEPRLRVNGVDEGQRLARIRAGIDPPRVPTPKPVLVDGVVPVRCERCECTGARLRNARDYVCGFCGASVRGVVL